MMLQKPASDFDGVTAVTWTDVAGVFASFRATGGGERVDGVQVEAEVHAVISIRYMRGVSPRWRFRWQYDVNDTRYFEIDRVLDIEGDRHVLTCFCKEVMT